MQNDIGNNIFLSIITNKTQLEIVSKQSFVFKGKYSPAQHN